MWRSKKFIVGAVLVAVVLAVSIGGAVLAADNGSNNQTETKTGTPLIDRVLEIYQEQTGVAIDLEVLKDAFAQARSEQLATALQNRLDQMVADGVITQGEADAYLEWWQARPDISLGLGLRGHGGFFGLGGPCGMMR